MLGIALGCFFLGGMLGLLLAALLRGARAGEEHLERADKS